MSKQILYNRRHFLGKTLLAVGATELAMIGFASGRLINGNSTNATLNKKNMNATFDQLKQIDAGVLNVGYAEAGPVDSPAVILLHGWPYDIYSFVEVTHLLTSAGYRVIVPYLRGFGTTRFLSDRTVRNGEQAAIAVDIIDLMDALKITKAIVAGFDWGARTADIIAALWPERCKALVSVSGYLIGNQESGKMPLPPKAEFQWWYQYYFASERGRFWL